MGFPIIMLKTLDTFEVCDLEIDPAMKVKVNWISDFDITLNDHAYAKVDLATLKLIGVTAHALGLLQSVHFAAAETRIERDAPADSCVESLIDATWQEISEQPLSEADAFFLGALWFNDVVEEKYGFNIDLPLTGPLWEAFDLGGQRAAEVTFAEVLSVAFSQYPSDFAADALNNKSIQELFEGWLPEEKEVA